MFYVVMCTLIGGIIASNKGRGGTVGAMWGLILGIIGVLIVASMSPDKDELARRAG